LRSIIAGSTAGAVEIAITYPAECASVCYLYELQCHGTGVGR